MDILNFELTDDVSNKPRDVVFGPQLVRSVGCAISLVLPSGWVAASVLGDLYGIESLSRNDGRIYITCQVASVTDIIHTHSEALNMGYIRLLPASTPCVDKNQVSILASVQGVGPHKHAYVTTTITKNQNAITLAALFDESAALFYRGVVSELADSVKDIA